MSVDALVVEAVDDATGEVILGSITPRIATPPLVTGPPGPCGCGCALTEATSYGFRVERFMRDVVKRPLWLWQRWLVIHAGELRPDGSPRFRRIIVTVGRQSGKTEVVIGLTLYWLLEELRTSVLGTSTLIRYARKPWLKAYELGRKAAPDRIDVKRLAMRLRGGEEDWWTKDGCHYAIAAANDEGGRSMSNERVIADELAKQANYDAYSAAYYSMDSFDDAQFWGLTTPDPKGVVYGDLRAVALAFIKDGEGDPTIGLFEWSADPVLADDDPQAIAQANPMAGRPGGKSMSRLLIDARAAVKRGGELLRTHRTEALCRQVEDDDRPIPASAWKACLEAGGFEGLGRRVAAVLDVGNSEQHATLSVAARLDDGRVRVAPVKVWEGPGCADTAVGEMPGLLAEMKPRLFATLPGGPGAAAAAKLKPRPAGGGRKAWPPPGVEVLEIKAELTQVSMGFASSVNARKILQSDDPLLNDDVAAAKKLQRPGGAWVFSRKGAGADLDALYSCAAAAFLAEQVKPPARTRLVGPDEE